MVESANLKFNHVVMRIASLALGPLQRLRAAFLDRAASVRSRHRHMELVESLSLGNRRQLFLVICDDHRFLVGAGADRVGTLVAMPESAADAAAFPPAAPKPLHREARDHRPVWMRGHTAVASGTRGLQLVKRDGGSPPDASRHGNMEAGRTRW